jgi:hypothetical protein
MRFFTINTSFLSQHREAVLISARALAALSDSSELQIAMPAAATAATVKTKLKIIIIHSPFRN